MAARAPIFVLRLLPVALVAGCCGDQADPWKPTDYTLEADADLNAAVSMGEDSVIVATADGRLIQAHFAAPELVNESAEYAGETPLNALAMLDQEVWAVGDMGTMLHRGIDGTWEPIDLGTSARLLDIVAIEDEEPEWGESPSGRLVVVGDGVVRVQIIQSDGGDGDGDGDGMWITPPEPAGGWGELRAVFGNLEHVWAVGAGGVAWHSTDPTGDWTAEDVGLGKVDLNDGGPRRLDQQSWTEDDFIVVGDAGSLAFYEGVRWMPISTKIDRDLVGYARSLVLDRDGRLFEFRTEGDHLRRRTGKVEGLNRGLCDAFFRHDSDAANPGRNDVVVFGVDGRLRRFEEDQELCAL